MNSLFCCETSAIENRAYPDPILLNDKRVLPNLLKTEERYTARTDLHNVQQEVTEVMRKIVAEWMLEVCADQKCQEEVFNLAINYMDRFLMVCNIRKNQLQLLGTACILIASKLREPKPIAAEVLVYYTDNSITRMDLWSWELLVLSKLKWDMAAVTPQDFLSHILRRIPLESTGIKYDMVNEHAKTLITLCAREYEFSSYPASMIASACVASALCGLSWPAKSGQTSAGLLNILNEITSIEQDFLRTCLKQIERMLYQNTKKDGAEEVQRPEEFTPPPMNSEKYDHETACTPTDVRDVHF